MNHSPHRLSILAPFWLVGLSALFLLVPSFARAVPPAGPPTAAAADLPTLLQRVTEARRRLAERDTGGATQAEQKAALALFDRLIEVGQRDQRSPRGEGGGGSAPGSKKDSSDDQPESDAPRDEQEMSAEESSADASREMANRRGPGGDWGKLRDKQREPVLNTLQEKFPPRYRQLVDRYFQSFTHERRPTK